MSIMMEEEPYVRPVKTMAEKIAWVWGGHAHFLMKASFSISQKVGGVCDHAHQKHFNTPDTLLPKNITNIKIEKVGAI